jgi:hypothetical protein
MGKVKMGSKENGIKELKKKMKGIMTLMDNIWMRTRNLIIIIIEIKVKRMEESKIKRKRVKCMDMKSNFKIIRNKIKIMCKMEKNMDM